MAATLNFSNSSTRREEHRPRISITLMLNGAGLPAKNWPFGSSESRGSTVASQVEVPAWGDQPCWSWRFPISSSQPGRLAAQVRVHLHSVWSGARRTQLRCCAASERSGRPGFTLSHFVGEVVRVGPIGRWADGPNCAVVVQSISQFVGEVVRVGPIGRWADGPNCAVVVQSMVETLLEFIVRKWAPTREPAGHIHAPSGGACLGTGKS